MAYFFDNLKNNFDFFLRKHLNYSRKNFSEKAQNLEDIKENEVYSNLSKKYDLSLFENSNRNNFMINLYFLNIFDKYFSKNTDDDTSVLDIGSKNWEYIKSEYLFFNSFNKNTVLNGIELDSYRLNSRFFSRYEVAKFYMKNLKNTNYIPGDLMEHNKKYDYIIWILPFITEYPLVKWGLPLKYFKPDKMLNYAYNLLNNNGQMLIINQGEYEYGIQKELIQKLNLSCEYFNEVEDNFNIFKNKRFCLKISKTN